MTPRPSSAAPDRPPLLRGEASPSQWSPAIHQFHDNWRIIAAVVVLLYHVAAIGLLDEPAEWLKRLAHMAVIVFFVVSGFSVTSSASRRGNAASFLSARLSRIYSLVVPGLIFVLLLDLASGGQSNPDYPSWQYAKWWQHLGINLLFLGEAWHLGYRPFTVIPYWSLSYEVWYYLMATAMLLNAGRASVLIVILMAVMAGPKILLLLPCWYLGVLLHKFASSPRPHCLPAMSMPLASLAFTAMLAAFIQSGSDAWLAEVSTRVCLGASEFTRVLDCGYSRWFLADYVVALLYAGVAATVTLAPRSLWRRAVHWLAPHTFGLYFLHYTVAMAAFVRFGKMSTIGTSLLAVALIVAICILLSWLFDLTRPAWDKLFLRGLLRISAFRRQPLPPV